MTFTKQLLSGSTNGKGIKIAATSSAGDTVHTAVNSTSQYDEIWLWAYNSHTSPIILTLQYGGTTSPDNDVKVTLAPQSGLQLVLAGKLLNNALVLKAFADTTNKVIIYGYVNNIQ